MPLSLYRERLKIANACHSCRASKVKCDGGRPGNEAFLRFSISLLSSIAIVELKMQETHLHVFYVQSVRDARKEGGRATTASKMQPHQRVAADKGQKHRSANPDPSAVVPLLSFQSPLQSPLQPPSLPRLRPWLPKTIHCKPLQQPRRHRPQGSLGLWTWSKVTRIEMKPVRFTLRTGGLPDKSPRPSTRWQG